MEVFSFDAEVKGVLHMQILAADWCKYNDCVLATGSVDKSIKTWDVRMPQREVAVLTGHTYAVRRCCTQSRTMPHPATQHPPCSVSLPCHRLLFFHLLLLI